MTPTQAIKLLEKYEPHQLYEFKWKWQLDNLKIVFKESEEEKEVEK